MNHSIKMELWSCGAIFPNPNTKLTRLNHSSSSSFSFYNSGRSYLIKTSLRATSSEETSTGSSQYTVEEPVSKIGYKPAEKKLYVGSEQAEKEEYTDDTTVEQAQAIEFLDNFDVKLDSGEISSMLLLGGSSLIAFWIATVLVGAIDSIPLFPNMMEVVGLSYTIWFSTRYLLFKKNRAELVKKIEEIKQQVIGSNGDDSMV